MKPLADLTFSSCFGSMAAPVGNVQVRARILRAPKLDQSRPAKFFRVGKADRSEHLVRRLRQKARRPAPACVPIAEDLANSSIPTVDSRPIADGRCWANADT